MDEPINHQAQHRALLELANTKMPFGKYAGKYLVDVPEFYRITSYNVCYTKLLRCLVRSTMGFICAFAHHTITTSRSESSFFILLPYIIPGRTIACRFKQKYLYGKCYPKVRITSYNVCYTKLLRDKR